MEAVIAIAVAILTGNGILWYRVGKLTNEVRTHNKVLFLILRKLNLMPENVKGKEEANDRDIDLH